MNIEELNILFDEINALNVSHDLGLKVCASYAIYLQSDFLIKNVKESKLVSDHNSVFYSDYHIPRDIDLVARFNKKKIIEDVFVSNHFSINKNLSLVPGIKRSILIKGNIKIDIFYDEFDFNHKIDLLKKNKITGNLRIDLLENQIPMAELLLQKLQIVEIGKKDLIAAWWIFKENDICLDYTDEGINMQLINEYLSKDWGFYYTVKNNIDKLTSLYKGEKDNTYNRIIEFEKKIDNVPKNIQWKLRKIIGKKIKWYNEVENI